MLYQIKYQCLVNDTEPNDLDNMLHSLTKRSLHYQCTIQDFHLFRRFYDLIASIQNGKPYHTVRLNAEVKVDVRFS
jgi:hypothetical protein